MEPGGRRAAALTRQLEVVVHVPSPDVEDGRSLALDVGVQKLTKQTEKMNMPRLQSFLRALRDARSGDITQLQTPYRRRHNPA